MSRRLVTVRLPRSEFTLAFRFREAERLSEWWLVVRGESRDICDRDPGHEVDFGISSTLRAFTEVWLGRRSLEAALATRRIRVAGNIAFERSLGDWLGFSAYASQPG